jgi:hypothetical protein
LGWSDEVRVMLRPFRVYPALAEELADARGWRLALRRPVRWLLVIGAFVSLSSAGRLVALHVASGFVFWSFFPLLQCVGVLVALAVVARERPRAAALDLYFAGQAPWLLFFVVLAGVCLFAPRVYDTFQLLLRTGILPGLFIVTLVWSTLLTWAFFRHGLGLSRRRAWLGFSVLEAVYGGSLVGYFLATTQLQPLLWGG